MLAEGTDRFADEFGHLSLKIGFAQLAGEAVREYFVERQPWARRQGKAGTKGIVIGAGEEIPQPFGQSSGVEPIGRAHVCTPVTNAPLVSRLPLQHTTPPP